MHGRECCDREIAITDVVVDQLQLVLYPLERFVKRHAVSPSAAGARGRLSAGRAEAPAARTAVARRRSGAPATARPRPTRQTRGTSRRRAGNARRGRGSERGGQRAGKPESRRSPEATRAPRLRGRAPPRRASYRWSAESAPADAQHPQHHVRVLDPAARLKERARLVSEHRPLDNSPEQRAPLLDLLVERVRPRDERRLQVVAAERQVERVERFPHLGRDHIAHVRPRSRARETHDTIEAGLSVSSVRSRATSPRSNASTGDGPPRPAPSAWRR